MKHQTDEGIRILFFFSRLLSRNINIKIKRTKSFPVALYDLEACSLTSRKRHVMSASENKVLRTYWDEGNVDW
jgi:hypothetical protein